MHYRDIDEFLHRGRASLRPGPVAVIMAEDAVEVESTLRHHLALGFGSVLLLAPDDLPLSGELAARLCRITYDVHGEDALVAAVDRLQEAAAGCWFYYGYNAEYLFYPFCETRSVRDLLAFHGEERRDAMLSYVIDLYAGDLERHPNAVSLEGAFLDRSGYYALGRMDPARDFQPRERQIDVFGGLRWRFEEHVPFERRRIDRIALFRARAGLRLRPDYTFSDEEYNTHSCPWHHNITSAVLSFRTAKALKSNPGSRFALETFRWHESTEFQWHSQQLMDLGLMEPGQWF